MKMLLGIILFLCVCGEGPALLASPANEQGSGGGGVARPDLALAQPRHVLGSEPRVQPTGPGPPPESRPTCQVSIVLPGMASGLTG